VRCSGEQGQVRLAGVEDFPWEATDGLHERGLIDAALQGQIGGAQLIRLGVTLAIGHHFDDVPEAKVDSVTRTRLMVTSLLDSFEGRDAMVASGMEVGIREGYERLDELLAG
jgi:hypothetical protein